NGESSSNVPHLLSRTLRDLRKGLEGFPKTPHTDDDHCRVCNQVEGLFLSHFEKPVERHFLECLLIPKVVLVLPDPKDSLLYASRNSRLNFCCQRFTGHRTSPWWSNENRMSFPPDSRLPSKSGF